MRELHSTIATLGGYTGFSRTSCCIRTAQEHSHALSDPTAQHALHSPSSGGVVVLPRQNVTVRRAVVCRFPAALGYGLFPV